MKRISTNGVYVVIDVESQKDSDDHHIYDLMLNRKFKKHLKSDAAIELVYLFLNDNFHKRLADIVNVTHDIIRVDMFNAEDPIKPGDLVINIGRDLDKAWGQYQSGYYDGWIDDILEKYKVKTICR